MTENLAEVQGGNSQIAHAHINKDLGKTHDQLGDFLKKGEAILNSVTASLQSFENHSSTLKELGKTVQNIQEEVVSLKRKNDTKMQNNDNKIQRMNDDDSELEYSDGPDHENDEADDGDDFFSPTNEGTQEMTQGQDGDFLQDLDEFFEEEAVLGKNVSETVGNIVNRSLRGNPDQEKLKCLLEKYKRPGNIDNLQVPKIDSILWDQLKARTKTGDYSRQRVIGHLNQAMLPLISAMEVLNEDITVSKATDDTRKLMAYMRKNCYLGRLTFQMHTILYR